MDHPQLSGKVVGNEFVARPPRLHAAAAVAALPLASAPSDSFTDADSPIAADPEPTVSEAANASAPAKHHISRLHEQWHGALSVAHRRSLITFSILILLVGSSGIMVGGDYWSARVEASTKAGSAVRPVVPSIAGLNMTMPAAQLQTTLQRIASQSAILTVGSQTTAIKPSVIQSWIQVTPSANKVQDYLSVKVGSIVTSIKNLAGQYVKAPVNQVSVSHTDGSPSGVIVAGVNGAQLSDPNGLTAQSQAIAKNLMDGRGFQINTPLATVPFQAVTPAAFPKLLEVNLSTKHLYAYQNGQLLQTFLVSAGKPSTPTPVGEFHVWAKFTKQTMKGPGYVQPNVPWVNYFDHNGDAVHGVYWRPASVFGNVNTSHGCVGIPVNDAEWVFNWAPIGTTVITYNNIISS